MKQKQCRRQQAARVRKAGALAAVGSVLAAGTLFNGGVSAQEVLPKPEAPVQGQDRHELQGVDADWAPAMPLTAPKVHRMSF